MNPKARWFPSAQLPEAPFLAHADPPIRGLWIIGTPLDALEPRVAIVGARNATSYGLEAAATIAAGLGVAGVCVVSGMARGIDRAAHEGALSSRAGRTVAVLAGGADLPYPRSSAPIYPEIVERGAVLSEEPLGSEHRRENFVKRNRIIAAISRVVVIVQAHVRRSGAMKTADAALKLGRTVLAVPGDIRSELSSGPHELLKHGAHPCTEAADVLDALGLEHDPKQGRIELPADLPADDAAVLSAVALGPGRIDDLARRAGLDSITAARALTRLEIAGLIRREGPTFLFRERSEKREAEPAGP